MTVVKQRNAHNEVHQNFGVMQGYRINILQCSIIVKLTLGVLVIPTHCPKVTNL